MIDWKITVDQYIFNVWRDSYFFFCVFQTEKRIFMIPHSSRYEKKNTADLLFIADFVAELSMSSIHFMLI